jgi:hypothetical protein
MPLQPAALRLGRRHWTGRPASEAQISALEQGVCGGVSVPDDYRAFLKACNGGSPIPIATGAFASFFELDADATEADLRIACIDFFNRIPPTMSPIGLDDSGKLLCLSFIGPNRGRVFLRDLDDLNAPLLEVAPSFAALLQVSDERDN